MLGKKELQEFFARLEGSEGCDFREDKKKKGKIVWKCKAGNDKTFAKRILRKMKIPKDEIKSFLGLCDEYGGHCDCEILFNAEERIMKDGL